MQAPDHVGHRLTCHRVPSARPVPTLAEDARSGLLRSPRSLPPKYFYDEIGSQLFEQICATPEYYPSRTEAQLLQSHAGTIIEAARPDHIVELGSGSARKTRYLLDACDGQGQHCMFWPFDVCEPVVMDSAMDLVAEYDWLTVNGLVGDYNGGLDYLPLPEQGRRLIVFLGGTIGNFEPQAARRMLTEIAALLRPGDHLLLGADRLKDIRVLEAAYNDEQGITARFNRNVLHVLNRELGADFPVAGYRHRAVFNPEYSRIEMRLRAIRDHRVRMGELDSVIDIAADEEILTEISRKFSREDLQTMLTQAGLAEAAHFEAPQAYYSLVLASPVA